MKEYSIEKIKQKNQKLEENFIMNFMLYHYKQEKSTWSRKNKFEQEVIPNHQTVELCQGILQKYQGLIAVYMASSVYDTIQILQQSTPSKDLDSLQEFPSCQNFNQVYPKYKIRGSDR